MSQTLEKKRVRLEIDAGSYENAKDRFTSKDPMIWKLNDVRFEIGAFLNLKGGAPASGSEVDISNWQSLTVEVKAAGGASNLMAATVTAFDDTLTAATWNDLSKQHAVVEFTNAETNIDGGTYDVAVSVIFIDGSKITLAVTKLTIKDSHASFPADPAPLNPGSAVSLAEADARYLQRIFETAGTPIMDVTMTGTGGSPLFDIKTTNGDFAGLVFSYSHLGAVVWSLHNGGAMSLGGGSPSLQFGTTAKLHLNGAILEVINPGTLALGEFAAGAAELASLIVGGDIRFDGLPTSDPTTTGRLWIDMGVLKVSGF